MPFLTKMAAPHIPNLNTLRTARGGSTGRARGRHDDGSSDLAGSSTVATGSAEQERAAAGNKDGIVQQTDQDASVSRLSAVEVGYLEDPFAKLFVSSQAQRRRFPIINRGR